MLFSMKYLRLSALTLVLSLMPFGARAVTLDEARTYIQNEQYAEAVHAFRSLWANKTIAQRADCNKWFGQALCMTGAYGEAVPYLEYAAKRQVKGAYWYLAICRQKAYDFEGAVKAATQYKTAMKSSALWAAASDSLIAQCEAGMKAVNHVRDVVIIDSLTVPRQQFFLHYRPGAESGRLLAAADCGHPFTEAADDMVFESQDGTLRLFVPQSDDTHIYESHLAAGVWDDPRALDNLPTDGSRIAYPYLRSDGETLYFALRSGNGLGEYDLYETHYDAESESYYTPERLPMPFNSPVGDFMLAVDETHQVGWWATDRHAAADFVTIYLYLIDEEPAYLSGEQVEAARIDALRDTWRNDEGYASLVAELMEAPQEAVATGKEFIVINDDHVYTSADEFRSTDARTAYEQAQQTAQELTALQEQLDAAREEWHAANTQQRIKMSPRVWQMELKEQMLQQRLASLQERYRNYENLTYASAK